MPKKSVPSSTPIHTNVAAAFFDSGRRNAGTPLEIASTPVSATSARREPLQEQEDPEAAAPTASCRRRASGRTAPWRCARSTTGSARTRSGRRAHPCRCRSEPRRPDPDSFTPRMFNKVIATINTTPTRDTLIAQTLERRYRHDGRDARGDRHRDREHVVGPSATRPQPTTRAHRCSRDSQRRHPRRRDTRRSPAGTTRSRSTAAPRPRPRWGRDGSARSRDSTRPAR